MSSLTVGNIAVDAQRALRRNSKFYGEKVIRLIDEIIAEDKLSPGGVKEMLIAREIFCTHFRDGGSELIESVVKILMGFAFMERSK